MHGPSQFSEARVVLKDGRPIAVVVLAQGGEYDGQLWASELDYGQFHVSAYRSFDEYYADNPNAGVTLSDRAPPLAWGEFHPRIAWAGSRVRRDEQAVLWDGQANRPYRSFFQRHHEREAQAAHVSTLPLYHRLSGLFESVEPHPRNRASYGHAIRHLLILAATEVEASWRAILEANSYRRDRFTTNDYVKLNPVLRLSEWGVRLAAYPDWPVVTPFLGWTSAEPTRSLPWYDAYNAVKHNREGDLPRATLEHVIGAMASVAILGWAQFGEQLVGMEMVPHTALFLPQQRPQWAPDQVYFGPDNDEPWKAVPMRTL